MDNNKSISIGDPQINEIVSEIRLPYNKGKDVFVFRNLSRRHLRAMADILHNFEADARDGFVSNVNSWIGSQCKKRNETRVGAPSPIKELKVIIDKAYLETFQISQDIKQLLTLSE